MMNIQHMRYVIEVERQGSISKAAEALYMNQPNLSKAVRELENTLGITIFRRTTKGVTATPEGGEFLNYARSIITQIDEIESHYRPSTGDKQSFRISVPRSSYIAHAFTDFVSELDMSMDMNLYFSETNSMRAIQNILEEEFRLGVIRYRNLHEDYFLNFLKERDLGHREILDFGSLVLLSAKNPLSEKESLDREDLDDLIELAHGDLRIPNLPQSDKRTLELNEVKRKRIHVYERGSQLDLLTRNPKTYMWVSPMPEDILERSDLVQKRCGGVNLRHKDILIYPRGYGFTKLEKAFIQKLEQAAEQARKYA